MDTYLMEQRILFKKSIELIRGIEEDQCKQGEYAVGGILQVRSLPFSGGSHDFGRCMGWGRNH